MAIPLYDGNLFRAIQDIPEKYRSLFSSYPCFNRVQSAVFDDIIESNCSLVVTAPTGSGKTVLFELALIKLLMDVPNLSTFKAVYVAPVKALCNERFQDWSPRLEPLGISCVEVTGDSLDHSVVQDHQLILTTPEKWDSLTRRWRDNMSLVQLVKLMMIDEVHLLSDSKRGPTLETIVCRMKTVMNTLKTKTALRFIAVSATIYNIEDLAQWLGNGGDSARFHRFGNEMRPVTLKRVVKGYPQSKGQSPFLFDIQLSYKLKPLIAEYAEGKPVLIFCSTRRGVFQTCKVLAEQLGFNFTPEQVIALEEIASNISDGKLREFVRSGAGYHHAGMTVQDRTLMQDAFTQGSLPVLVATTTLAMGVNLPAHLVIIKSTHQYIAGRIVEYQESSVLQMVGRAGRPQFDTSATAVIMTRFEMTSKYENLLDCKEVLESNLHLHLAEHLNSEIVLYTITDLGIAMDWLRSTFLYQRALKNPQHYGLSGNVNNPSKIDKDLETMVLRELNALQRAELATLNENGMDISPTANGRLMSHYFINLHTFELFTRVASTSSIKDILSVLSEANELNEIQLRVNERRILNELNVSKQSKTIRFPLEGKIKSREMKINCLAQACLGCLAIPDPALQQEGVRIVNVLERIVKCLTEYLCRKKSYCSMLSSTILCKCLHAKLWENSDFVARQLDRIGASLGALLVTSGKTTFEALLQTHARELERIMNRGPPMGDLVIDQIRHLPVYALNVSVDRETVLSCLVNITIKITNVDFVSEHSTAGSRHAVVVIVGDTNNRLLHHRRALDTNILEAGLQFSVQVGAPLPQKIFVHIVSEQWVGIDVIRDVLINPMANTLVGGHCYLPSPEMCVNKQPKKGKNNLGSSKTPAPANTSKQPKKSKKTNDGQVTSIMPEASKQKGTISAAILSKPATVSVSHSTVLPLVEKATFHVNLDSYKNCCFDLEPDWEEYIVEDLKEGLKNQIVVPTAVSDEKVNRVFLNHCNQSITSLGQNEEEVMEFHGDQIVRNVVPRTEMSSSFNWVNKQTIDPDNRLPNLRYDFSTNTNNEEEIRQLHGDQIVSNVVPRTEICSSFNWVNNQTIDPDNLMPNVGYDFSTNTNNMEVESYWEVTDILEPKVKKSLEESLFKPIEQTLMETEAFDVVDVGYDGNHNNRLEESPMFDCDSVESNSVCSTKPQEVDGPGKAHGTIFIPVKNSSAVFKDRHQPLLKEEQGQLYDRQNMALESRQKDLEGELENILNTVLNRDTFLQAKAASPSKTMDSWYQLEQNYLLNTQQKLIRSQQSKYKPSQVLKPILRNDAGNFSQVVPNSQQIFAHQRYDITKNLEVNSTQCSWPSTNCYENLVVSREADKENERPMVESIKDMAVLARASRSNIIKNSYLHQE